MKKFLLTIGLSLVLLFNVNAANYFVRSDAAGTGDIVWSSTSNPSDIFTFDSSVPNTDCACVTVWPNTTSDNIFNYSGRRLVINEDANTDGVDGDITVQIVRARYSGSGFESYADLKVARYVQVYDDTQVDDSFFRNITQVYLSSTADMSLYGTFRVANLNSSEVPGTTTTVPIKLKTATGFTTVIRLMGLLKLSNDLDIPSTCELIIDRSLHLGDTYDTDYWGQIYAGMWLANNRPNEPGPRDITPGYGRIFPDGGAITGVVTYAMAGVWNDQAFFPRQTSRFEWMDGVVGSGSWSGCCNRIRTVLFGVPLSGMTPLDIQNEPYMLLQGVSGMTDPYAGDPTWDGFILQDDTEDYPTYAGGTWAANPNYSHTDSDGEMCSTWYIDEDVSNGATSTMGNYNTVNMGINDPFLRGKGYGTWMTDANRITYQVSNYFANSENPHTELTVSGSVDFSNFSFDVTYNSSNPGTPDVDQNFAGRNLISNPYLGSIKWTGSSTGGWTLSNISPTIKMAAFQRTNTFPAWDAGYTLGGGGIYHYDMYNAIYNIGTGSLANGIIPVGAAFYVEATGASPSLSVTSAAIVEGDDGSATSGTPDPNQGFGNSTSLLIDGSYIKFSLADNEAAIITDSGADDDVDPYDMNETGVLLAGGNYIVPHINAASRTSPDDDAKHIGTGMEKMTHSGEYKEINLFVRKEFAEVHGAHFSSWEFDLAPNIYAWIVTKHNRAPQSLSNKISTLEGSNPDYFGDLYDANVTDPDGDGYVYCGHILLTYGNGVPYFGDPNGDPVKTAFDANIINNEDFSTINTDTYSDYEITIIDVTGKVMHKGSFSGFTYRFNTSEFAPGIYIYTLQSKEGLKSDRFIVN